MSTIHINSRFGRQYLGNSSSSKMEVHDLRNEKTQCQVDAILRAGHAVGFVPDTLFEAHRCAYDNCAYCIGGSNR
jgi:hypothetical protein